MLEIHIKTIPDSKQRYDTTGDYQTTPAGVQTITVSDLGDKRYEFLIAIHELIESFLCSERGITDEMIDQFDMTFEKQRQPGDQYSEPGDDASAPYQKEHKFATKIETLVADELGVDWDEYTRICALRTDPN